MHDVRRLQNLVREVVIGMPFLGIKKSKQKGGIVANTCNMSTQEKRQGCGFEAILDFMVSSRLASATL